MIDESGAIIPLYSSHMDTKILEMQRFWGGLNYTKIHALSNLQEHKSSQQSK